jgi:cell division protein FtsZ
MSFHLTEPILVIGLGGAGSKLATEAKESLHSDCLLISHDQNDLTHESFTIKISTDSIVNPSMQLIRGCTLQASNEIREKISQYSTIILMANLAGKTGAAMAPVVSSICKESNKSVLSFAIMPFGFEKDRIFNSGTSLKRLRVSSDCSVVLDNDALLDSNPDLSPAACHKISNAAIQHVVNSLKSSAISEDTNILSTSKDVDNIETSLKDSIRMLYEDAPPDSVKRSILYVLGGNDIPVRVLNSVSSIVGEIFNEDNTSVISSINTAEKSKVVMLTSVQGETHFDKYDPLSIIPADKTLDWEDPDCSINCELDLHQLE